MCLAQGNGGEAVAGGRPVIVELDSGDDVGERIDVEGRTGLRFRQPQFSEAVNVTNMASQVRHDVSYVEKGIENSFR
jgi:hypothetical protein